MGLGMVSYTYRPFTLALALAACGGSGGGTDPTASTSGSSTSQTGTGTEGPTDTSAETVVDGSDADSLTGPTGTAPPTASEPTTDPGTDTGTTATSDPDTTATSTGDTTSPVSATDTSTGDPPPPNCGDGKVDEGEQCDDGVDNAPDGDCLPDCSLHVCGDGVVAPAEQCDLGDLNGPDNGCSTECLVLPSACGNQSIMAELTPLPVDVIMVIDNSGSMTEEIQAVQNNINTNFAKILDAAGVDYRVIVLSRHGKLSDQSVCIEAPLSGVPMGGCANPPVQPAFAARFFHYSREIASTDPWCRILGTVDGDEDDEFGLAVDGWQQWLRPDSFKTFVELSDDRAQCNLGNVIYADTNTFAGSTAAAAKFDAALRALLPQHFGDSPQNRNYRWHSIIGLAYNNPPDAPYQPKDPFVTSKCPEGVNPGYGHQALSILTDGTRFPLCNTASYDAVFQTIADDVIGSAKLACEYDVPEAPEDKVLDKDSVSVTFTPMGMGMPIEFDKVDGPGDCDADSFYLAGDKVILCPEACDSIQGNDGASIAVEFSCEPLTPK
jgi:cysteine-rich repeat protein